jgi:hypothetical protein
VCDDLVSIGQACLDILSLKPRIPFEDRLGRVAGRKHAENVFNGQPSSPDNRLAAEDRGIEGDSFEQGFLVHDAIPHAFDGAATRPDFASHCDPVNSSTSVLFLKYTSSVTGTPSLALHLIERCPEILNVPVKNLGIQILMLGAEVLPRLEKEVQERMHKLLKIRPAIEWLAPNTLERAARKTQRLEKRYEPS